MWIIQFQARIEGIHPQFASLTAGNAASIVESALSVALLELCGHVQVEAVQVEYEAEDHNGAEAYLRILRATDVRPEHGVN
jgi:hypothetical protein